MNASRSSPSSPSNSSEDEQEVLPPRERWDPAKGAVFSAVVASPDEVRARRALWDARANDARAAARAPRVVQSNAASAERCCAAIPAVARQRERLVRLLAALEEDSEALARAGRETEAVLREPPREGGRRTLSKRGKKRAEAMAEAICEGGEWRTQAALVEGDMYPSGDDDSPFSSPLSSLAR